MEARCLEAEFHVRHLLSEERPPANMTPAKDPKQQNRTQNRAKNRTQNRDQQYGNMFNDFFKSTAQKGREYSHWIDLMLIVILRRSFPTSIARKSDVCQNRRFWGQQKGPKRYKKVQRPQNRFVDATLQRN